MPKAEATGLAPLLIRQIQEPSSPARGFLLFSRTLRPDDYPHIVVSDDAERFVSDLRTKPGKDIALFGGASCFEACLRRG
jgi:dihydrofolate reductase